jgi:undecaprenyl-diphosphatase
MTPIAVRPTRADLSVAEIISTHTGPRTERAAEFLTWGADEHILCALAAGWWLYCRGKDANARRASDHILLTTLVSSGLPHILKTVFDRERPDRRTIQGHWRGVPFSGKRLDALPSGHAVHVGALASAASTLPVRQRNVVWGIGAGLVATGVVLLAHWASDVAAGLVVGAVTERILRLATGYGRERVCQQASQRALPPWPYLSSWRRAKQRNSSM